MFFGFFQSSPTEPEDDIATGTYADGVIGTPVVVSTPPRDRSQMFRRAAKERDYGTVRNAGQTGAGMVA